MPTKRSYSKFKSQAEKVLWITLFWTLISISQFVVGYTTLMSLNCNVPGVSPMVFLLGSIVSRVSAGLLGGSFIVFVWSKWLRKMAYGKSLLNIFWSYSVIFFLVGEITEFFAPASQQPLDIVPETGTWLSLTTIETIFGYLFWLSIVIVTIIALLVNDKYGPGVFVSFLLGKYFHPKREERIFMFLDLRGSTGIAEKLGENRYFNFVKDVFQDATPGITRSKGEIYQYVGDEIVISWKKDQGFRQANCLQCFFDIQQRFLDKASYYRESYEEIVPEFKAGLHYGFVMVGEIGIVKRDIAYSGDVLNTTARIQSKCNEIGVNILISKYLVDGLTSFPNPFQPKEIGEMALRGKEHAVMLYTV